MGEIVIEGIRVDTEDLDILVRYCPLGDLEKLVVVDEQMLVKLGDDAYWKHRAETHRIARDIAQWCWDNDIPTIDLPRKERDRTQGLFALEKCRDLEKHIRDIDDTQKGFERYAVSRLDSLFHTLKEMKEFDKSKAKRHSKYD